MKFQFHAVGAGTIGLVDDEDVGDFHDAGLDGLNVVTHAGDEDDYGHLGDGGDVDFVLPDANGLDDHVIPAGGVHQAGQVGGGTGQAADGSASGHGADEDSGIGVVLLHADTIAEDGAAGDPTAGVHGEDGESLPTLAQFQRERIHQRALARAGRAGDAHDARVAGGRLQFPQGLEGLWIAILDAGGQTRQCTRVPFANFAGQCGHQPFNN